MVLCFSVNLTAFASETNNTTFSITVPDENGNDKQYNINITEDSVTEIPIYAAKEAKEGTIESQALIDVATLTISYDSASKNCLFVFEPTSIPISLITRGFLGDFKTYHSGTKYGYNVYAVPVLRGAVSAPATGTGSLSGGYMILGYKTVPILEAFA